MVDLGSIMISEVQASDAGKYECSAQSMAGSKTAPPVQLKVLAPPTIIRGPQDSEVIEGEGLDLPCEVSVISPQFLSHLKKKHKKYLPICSPTAYYKIFYTYIHKRAFGMAMLLWPFRCRQHKY